jgi:uncharacterized protein YlxW (UPF0749 family)
VSFLRGFIQVLCVFFSGVVGFRISKVISCTTCENMVAAFYQKEKETKKRRKRKKKKEVSKKEKEKEKMR